MDLTWIKELFVKKEVSLEETAHSGKRAKELWENIEFQKAIRNVRLGILEKWTSSPIQDMEGQHELRLMLKILDDVEGNIRKTINDGFMSETLIKDKTTKDNRVKNIMRFRR